MFKPSPRLRSAGSSPPWLRVMNISISCCLTSLIIVTAALILSLVGMFYRQATCLLVDCVLLLISVFFFLLSLSLHWAHRQPRAASLLGSSLSLLTCQPGWSQYLGLIIIITTTNSSVLF